MKLTLTILTVAATLFASSASAYDPDDLQKLKDTKECIQCNLSDANLRGAILLSANLRDASLIYANLKGAILEGADLEGADLKGANLSDADLSGANLKGANLGYAYMNGAILCNTTMPDGSVIYSGC